MNAAAPAAGPSGALLFVSDIHLSADRPGISERFFRFLATEAAHASAVFVLGDLFDYWIGDDELDAADGDPLARRVVDAFAGLARTGVRIAVMHGNRDFLMGDRFAKAALAEMLPDPYVLEHSGERLILSHGDALCTDDAAYQRFREQVRGSGWQRQFLAAPLTERRAIMQGLRERSEREKKFKSAAIMDVNPDAVAALLRTLGGRRLIHGHTHRPARHSIVVDGAHAERWVLPDWYERGGYLMLGPSGFALEGA